MGTNLRFEDFELDPGAYRLRHKGVVVHLERIPFDLLCLIVERGGQTVTRVEILDRVWGKGVFVDGEHGINTAVRKIRRALNDDADSPRFVVTIAAKGYRFIAPVSRVPISLVIPCESNFSFVGRDREVAELQAGLSNAASGRGGMFLISGEPGIGKTRLAEELASHALANRVAVMLGHCSDHEETVPYLPFVEILESWIEQVSDSADLRAALGPDGPELARLVPRLRRILPDLPASLELAPQQARRHLFNSFCDFIARMARGQPTLVIIDDLHWADESTLAMLEHLSLRLAALPLVVFATYRDIASNVGDALGMTLENLSRSRLATRFKLRRLSPDGVGMMLRNLSGQAPPTTVVNEIYAETGGNPFFVEELFRHLDEENRLYDIEGRFRSELRIGDREVPHSVRLIVSHRVRRLSSFTQEMLAVAAIIGRSFTVAMLASVCNAEWLSEAIEQAEKAEIISSRPGEPRFEFSHELVRQAVLAGIPTAGLRQFHLTVAAAIEQIHANDLDDHTTELAHHYRFGGNMGKAIDYLVMTARQAVARKAFSEAILQLRTALTLLDGIPEHSERSKRELAIRTPLGLQIINEGPGAPIVESNLLRARKLCHELNANSEILPILTGLRTYYRYRLELGKALEVAEELLAAVSSRDPSVPAVAFWAIGDIHLFRGELSVAYWALGDIHLFRGEFISAQSYFMQSMGNPEVYRTNGKVGTAPGSIPLITTILASCVWTYWVLGYPEQALNFHREAFECARQHKIDTTPIFHALTFSVRFNQWLGDFSSVREQSEELLMHATKHGMPFYGAIGTACKGWALAHEGNIELGIKEMGRASAAFEDMGVAARSIEAAPLVEVYGEAGQLQEGLAILAEALGQIEKTGERICEAELHRLKGELLLKQSPGNTAPAEIAFQKAIETARQRSAKSWELRAVTSLARLLAKQGKRNEARNMLADIYNWFTEGFDTADLKDAKALLDELGA